MLLCGETAPGTLNPRRIFGGSRLTVKRNTGAGKWDNRRRYRLGLHSGYGWLIDRAWFSGRANTLAQKLDSGAYFKLYTPWQ